jgi:hypothetical protein
VFGLDPKTSIRYAESAPQLAWKPKRSGTPPRVHHEPKDQIRPQNPKTRGFTSNNPQFD